MLERVEDGLERTRVMCSTTDKRLDALKKEKSLQDKTQREIHDQIQEKANISELRIFETKFTGYITRLEHQELVTHVQSLGGRNDDTDILMGKIRHLESRFDDYTRSARIEEDLSNMRSRFDREIGTREKTETVTRKIADVLEQLRSCEESVDRGLHGLEDKIRSVADRITSVYVEVEQDLQTKAENEKVNGIADRLEDFALKVDTDAFMKDCLPRIKHCSEAIEECQNDMRARDVAFNRLDEVLMDKASKYEVVVANARIDACMQKEYGMKELEKLGRDAATMKKRVEHYILGETDRFSRIRPQDHTGTFEAINRSLLQKAEKCDVVDIYGVKANRIDHEDVQRLQDRVNRQLEYLAVTTFGLAKLCLAETKEDKNTRTQQKSQVLMQTEALWQWVSSNEPPPNLNTLKINKMDDDRVMKKRREHEEKLRLQIEQKLGIVDIQKQSSHAARVTSIT